jgi:hypothetical protein
MMRILHFTKSNIEIVDSTSDKMKNKLSKKTIQ